MLREQVKLFNRLLGLSDAVLIALAMILATLLAAKENIDIRQPIWTVTMAVPIWVYLLAKYRLYAGTSARKGIYDVLTSVFSVHVFGGGVLAGLLFIFRLDHMNRGLYLAFLAFSFCLFLLSRFSVRQFVKVFSHAKDLARNVVIVGAQDEGQELYRLIQEHAHWGLTVLGFVQIDSDVPQKKEVWCKTLGEIKDIVDICKKQAVDEVIFCPPRNFLINVDSYVRDLEELGITVHLALDIYQVPRSRTEISLFHDRIPILTFYSKAFDSRQLLLKRLLDIFGALVGLTITALLFPFIAFAIKKDSAGPLFFGQERVGQSGRTFKCWKFRSMYIDAEERKKELMAQNEMNGAIFKIKDDPRITKVGDFLRKSSLDELPQFWNVLKGEMSLVGTRPPTPDEVAQYENWHRRRICIKPGITGNWQISGRNKIEDFDDIVNLDLQYIDNWNFWLDIKILIKTVMVVFAREGSY